MSESPSCRRSPRWRRAHLDHESLKEEGKAGYWDYATAVEASVALEDLDGALKWLRPYLEHTETDAFELASTHRQLSEVWGLNQDSRWDVALGPLQAGLIDREGGAATLTPDVVAKLRDRDLSVEGYEAVLGAESFQTFVWFQKGLTRAGAVGFLTAELESEDFEAMRERMEGTGFLIEGGDLHPSWKGELVMVTNSHVVSDEDLEAKRPEEVLAGFTIPIQGQRDRSRVKLLWTSVCDDLDCTVSDACWTPVHADRLPDSDGASTA